MTAEPAWLTLDMVLAIHDEQLAAFGGGTGMRDLELLESALARPQNRYDQDCGIFDLAAAYGFGIVSNHPFVDGNKRTGLLAMNAFLALNGRRFEPEQTDEVRTLLALASGEVEEEVLARWIERNSGTD